MVHNINIILTRHGRYDKTKDIDLGGHITEAGKREIEEKTRQRVESVVGNNIASTLFLVVGSPTFWLSKEQYGQRAKETEQITNQTIKTIIEEHRCSTEDAFYSKPQMYTRKGKVSIQELGKMLSEPNVYDEAYEYIRKLKLRHGGMTKSFWYELANSEEAKEYSSAAETPSDLNIKIKNILEYVIEWARDYSKEIDKDICVFLITHGETLEPFINNTKLRSLAGLDYNEGIVFEVGEDQIVARAEYSKDEQFIGPKKPVMIGEKEIEVR